MQGRAVLVLGEMGTAPLQVSTVPPESFCIQPSSLRLTWRDVGADKCYPPPAECYPPPAEAGPEVDTVQLPSQITPVTAVSPLSYSLPTVPPFPACPTSCSVTVVYAVPVTVTLMHTPSAACPAFPVTPVHTELLSPASASGPPPAAEPPSKEAHRVICLSAGESPRLPSQGVKRNPSPWPSVPVSAPPPMPPSSSAPTATTGPVHMLFSLPGAAPCSRYWPLPVPPPVSALLSLMDRAGIAVVSRFWWHCVPHGVVLLVFVSPPASTRGAFSLVRLCTACGAKENGVTELGKLVTSSR